MAEKNKKNKKKTLLGIDEEVSQFSFKAGNTDVKFVLEPTHIRGELKLTCLTEKISVRVPDSNSVIVEFNDGRD